MDWGDIILLLSATFITYKRYVPFTVSLPDPMSSDDLRAASRNAQNRGPHQQLSGLVTFGADILLGASGVAGIRAEVQKPALAQVMQSQRRPRGLRACGARGLGLPSSTQQLVPNGLIKLTHFQGNTSRFKSVYIRLSPFKPL